MVKRREILKAGGLLAGLPLASAFLPAVAGLVDSTAPTGEGKFFVMLRGFGGMDATLGLDPWTAASLPDPKDMFVEYRPDEVISAGGEVKLGPSAAPLKAHAGSFSVVNGVFMSQSDNGHGASQDYISAGSGVGTAAVLPVELAYATKEGDFGVLNNSTLRVGTRAITSSNTFELAQIKNKQDISGLLSAIFGDNSKKTPYFDSVRKVINSRQSVQAFIKNLESFGKPEELTEKHVIAAAFMTEVAFCAQIDPTGIGIIDTHANHPGNHIREQKKVWQGVADLFTLFKNIPYGGGSLFDRTTFMIASEFSRTPALNSSMGKDHNPFTNSVLLAGRGVQGGRVIGASRLVTAKESPTGSSYHIAYPIDYKTGEVQRERTPQAQMIFPENVAQTVAGIMNVDRNLFQSIPHNTLTLPLTVGFHSS